MIRHEGNKWILESHSGKKLGTYTTKKAAVAREKQVKMFKHMKPKK